MITGPTAVGKSELGMALARRAPGEIIVADCMQVYRGLDVGTGKPCPADRAEIAHHLLDICDPSEPFSAWQFGNRAHQLVQEIQSRGHLPILVGGTGLYLRAFLKGRLAGPGGNPEIRDRLRREAEIRGVRALHERLASQDTAAASRIHPNDLFRIVRALELLEMAGRPLSELRPDLWDAPQVTVSAMLVLTRERAELYRLIDERARRMWEGGLVEEVRGLLAAGFPADLQAFKALGYRQAVAYLLGRQSAAEALAAMQGATRHYARRQLTWFRREPAAEWVTVRGWDWVEPLADSLLERLGSGKDATKSTAAESRLSNVE